MVYRTMDLRTWKRTLMDLLSDKYGMNDHYLLSEIFTNTCLNIESKIFMVSSRGEIYAQNNCWNLLSKRKIIHKR